MVPHEHPFGGALLYMPSRFRVALGLASRAKTICDCRRHRAQPRAARLQHRWPDAGWALTVFVCAGPPPCSPRASSCFGEAGAGGGAPATGCGAARERTSAMMLRDRARTTGAGPLRRCSILASRIRAALRVGPPRERAARLKPDALVMHPGPINRGVELRPADRRFRAASSILDQV